jgi:hypothetical protein
MLWLADYRVTRFWKTNERITVSVRKSSSHRHIGSVESLEQRTLMSASFLVPAVHPFALDAAGDLNGDRKADLVTVENTVRSAHPGGVNIREAALKVREAALTVRLGNGDGSFGDGSVRFLLPAVQVANVATGDFNGDGSVDVVLVEGAESADPGAVHLLLGNGDGTLRPHVLAGRFDGFSGDEVHVADFNGDGAADLAIEQHGIIAILIGLLRQGGFEKQQTVDLPYIEQRVLDVAAGDVNGDGRADIAAVLGDGSVRVALNGPGFLFQDQGAVEGFNGAVRVAAGDVNGDGFHDLIMTGDGSVFVARGSERGLVPAVRSEIHLLPAVQRSLHVADVNGDGKADLLVSDILGRPRAVFFGQADGTFAKTIGGIDGSEGVLG